MKGDLDPTMVAANLAELRAIYVPEHVAAARFRLDAEYPKQRETFEQRAGRSLRELRALCELAGYLRRGRT